VFVFANALVVVRVVVGIVVEAGIVVVVVVVLVVDGCTVSHPVLVEIVIVVVVVLAVAGCTVAHPVMKLHCNEQMKQNCQSHQSSEGSPGERRSQYGYQKEGQ